MPLAGSPTGTSRRREHTIVAAAALAACLAGVLNDFVYDDVPLIVDNVRLHSLTHFTEIVSRPWWPPPFTEQLYRPLSALLLALQWALGNGDPLVFRLFSYGLYVGTALAFYRLAGMLISRRAAFASSVLFAVHPVHVEAVALGVNQGELVVGLSALVATARYIAGRRGHGLDVGDWVVIASLYAVAILAKENGYVLPALLLAAELTVIRGAGTAQPLRSLWHGYAGLAAVAVAGLTLRRVVLGGVVGAAPVQALRGLSLGQRAFSMLQIVPEWFRLLVWPQHLQADFPPDAFALPTVVGLPELAGVALVVTACFTFVAARRSRPVVAFGIAWCAVALVPVSNLIPTGIMLAERTLFLPSVGFLLVIGTLGEVVAGQRRWRPALTRRLLQLALAVFAILGLARSANRHFVWNSAHFVVVPPRP